MRIALCAFTIVAATTISARMAIFPLLRFRIFVVLCLTSVLFSTALHAANSFTPGQYQLTTMTKDGKPMKTTTWCFTPETCNYGDARTIEKIYKGRCTVKNYNVTGNKESFSLLCGKMVMTISTTYQQESYEADTTTNSVSVHTSAKRIGACKEGGPGSPGRRK